MCYSIVIKAPNILSVRVDFFLEMCTTVAMFSAHIHVSCVADKNCDYKDLVKRPVVTNATQKICR